MKPRTRVKHVAETEKFTFDAYHTFQFMRLKLAEIYQCTATVLDLETSRETDANDLF